MTQSLNNHWKNLVPDPDNFGIIIPVYGPDAPFVQGLLASIRHFLGSVPVCLIVEGSYNFKEIARDYDATLLYRKDFKYEVLRKYSYGWGGAGAVVNWESPFKHFLKVDSDIIIWGNVLEKMAIQPGDDFIASSPYSAINRIFLREEIFDPGYLGIYTDIPFPWENQPYFNDGFYYARRDQFDLDKYIDMIRLARTDRRALPTGNMGIMNYLVFAGAHAGRIRFRNLPIQTYVGMNTREQLQALFPMSDMPPAVPAESATVVHWLGPNKPYLKRKSVYPELMTWFRGLGLREHEKCPPSMIPLIMRYQDFRSLNTVQGRSLSDVVASGCQKILSATKVSRFVGSCLRYE